MKKLINICGTARCGSTMIDLILGNDPHGFSLGEVHAYYRPFRTHHFDISCSCKSADCPWHELMRLKESDFYKKAFKILNVDFLVDSSKDLAWVIDNNITAGNEGIQVHNILLYKDPLSFQYSFWKRGASINKSLKKSFIKYYKRCFQSGLSFILLNYNNFVSNPEAELLKLCDLIGIPYFPGKEFFWNKNHHQLFGSQGTRKQANRGNSLIIDKEEYPLEYRKLIENIEHDNLRNKALQDVLTKFIELENQKDNINTLINNPKKPYWYYLIKLKQKIRQKFPEKYI